MGGLSSIDLLAVAMLELLGHAVERGLLRRAQQRANARVALVAQHAQLRLGQPRQPRQRRMILGDDALDLGALLG